MIQYFTDNKGINYPTIGQATILLLMYADNVVLVSRTEEDTNKLMKVLEAFCELSGLRVNMGKTKAMLSKTRGKREKIHPQITYQGKPIEAVNSFKYLGLEIPSDHKWYQCATKRRENGKRAYYAFENMCRQAGIQSWNLKKYLFDTLVTPVILYGVEVWGGSLSKDRWNDIKKIQKLFLTNFLAIQRTTPYPTLLLEIGGMPLAVLGMEQLLRCIKKINKMTEDRLPAIAWKTSCKPPKNQEK